MEQGFALAAYQLKIDDKTFSFKRNKIKSDKNKHKNNVGYNHLTVGVIRLLQGRFAAARSWRFSPS